MTNQFLDFEIFFVNFKQTCIGYFIIVVVIVVVIVIIIEIINPIVAVIKLNYWWIIHQIVLNHPTFQKKVLHEGNEGNVIVIDYHEEGEDTCEGKGHD